MAFTLDELKAHYAQLPESGGLDSRCEMFVPGGLNDQMALDLACRRGKGVYKLSDHVVVAYPELIDQIGIEEGTLDYVYVNSALNLFYDPAHVIKLIGRLLKPAGKLVCQTVLATTPRDRQVMAQARVSGNAVQAAPNRKDFARWLHDAGMDMPTYETLDAHPIQPGDAAASSGGCAPVIETDEDARFTSCIVNVEKLGGFDYQAFLLKDMSDFR